jgi:hypothetical protein
MQTSWWLTRGKGFPAQVPFCEAGKMYLAGENPGSRQGWGAPESVLHCVAVELLQFFSWSIDTLSVLSPIHKVE